MHSYRWFVLPLCAGALVGCANYATLQDPETMPENKFQLGIGATVNAYPLETKSTTTQADGTEITETHEERFTVPAIALSGRVGVSERFELHGIAWLPLGASLGAKYMLLGDREQGGFAFSPGLDVSAPITARIDDESIFLMDFYVPLHMGYRFSRGAAVYWTPKYVLRVIQNQLAHAAGGTLGLALGDEVQFLIEGGALYDTLYEKTIFNGALGLAFMPM